MSNQIAPERIWAKTHGVSTDVISGTRGLIGGWNEHRRDGQTEYIRADLFDAQRDQMQAEIERLNAELSEARAQWDMWADRAMNELGENLTNRAALKGSQE